MPQIQTRTQLQVTLLKNTFEQQDGATPAQVAQRFGLVQIQKRKTVSTAQAFERAGNAVTVGIGLDHGPDPGIGSGSARAAQVVAQGLGVDGGNDGTRQVM